MAKRQWFPRYWAEEQPADETMMLVRFNVVRSGAGDHGFIIGWLGSPTICKVDMNEQDQGWVRIISVVGHDPVPSGWWVKEQQHVPPISDPVLQEWWIDMTALTPITQPGGILKILTTINLSDGSWETHQVD